jgi:hypothetical protein
MFYQQHNKQISRTTRRKQQGRRSAVGAGEEEETTDSSLAEVSTPTNVSTDTTIQYSSDTCSNTALTSSQSTNGDAVSLNIGRSHFVVPSTTSNHAPIIGADFSSSSSVVLRRRRSTNHDDDLKFLVKTNSVYCYDKDDTNQLTPYEIYRAQNIERNQRRLASLGLITDHEAKTAIDTAWGRKSRSVHENISQRCCLTGGSKQIEKGNKKSLEEWIGSSNNTSSSQHQLEEAWV